MGPSKRLWFYHRPMQGSPWPDSENAPRTLVLNGFRLLEPFDRLGDAVVATATHFADRRLNVSFSQSLFYVEWAGIGHRGELRRAIQERAFSTLSVKIKMNALTQSVGFANIMKCVS